MLTMLKKELTEQWRTYRFLVVGAVLVLFGLTSPLVARYTPEIIKSIGGLEGLDQMFPTPTAADAINQYLKNCFQFGMILALLVPMGAVVGEKDRGTAAMVLSKPVSRASFLLAKFVAAALVFLTAILVAALGAYYYTGVLFQWLNVGAFLLLNLLLWLDLLVYLALTMFASTLARSTVAAGVIGFGLFMVMWLVGIVPQVGRLLPDALQVWGASIALGLGGDPAWGAVGVSLGMIAVALVGAVLIFWRQEI